jgi:magnesium transporter
VTTPPLNVADVVEQVRAGDLAAVVTRAHAWEPADLADVLSALDDEERLALVQLLPAELASQALVEMPASEHAEETLAALPAHRAADIVDELDDDDAADILGEMDPEEAERILSAVEDRRDVDRLLRYDEETAGGRMTMHLIKVLTHETAGEALESIRRQADEVEDFYRIFVVDGAGVLRGILPLRELVVAKPGRPVAEIMLEPDVSVPPEMDQEAVARVLSRYNLASVPVVDSGGRLLGRVTFDDVIDVVEAESTEDILRFGGTSADENIGAGWRDAVRSRLPWLMLNLCTAFLAASVVYANRDLIERMTTLAALMPVIAGMGGNAGTQALAVTVRRIALGMVPRGTARRVVGKEALVGLSNGLAIGTLVALVSLLLGQGAMLGLAVFLAMTGNLLVAGVVGAFVPVLLERRGVDPAIASSIFVTTFTDICGFFFLLWLADRLLL